MQNTKPKYVLTGNEPVTTVLNTEEYAMGMPLVLDIASTQMGALIQATRDTYGESIIPPDDAAEQSLVYAEALLRRYNKAVRKEYDAQDMEEAFKAGMKHQAQDPNSLGFFKWIAKFTPR